MLSGVVTVLKSLRLLRDPSLGSIVVHPSVYLSPLLGWLLRRGKQEYLSLCSGPGKGVPLDWFREEEEGRAEKEGVLSSPPSELQSLACLSDALVFCLCCKFGEGRGLWPHRRPQVFVHEHVLAGESTGLRKPVYLSLV